MIYYIADPHFGHSNIIHLCQRPFADVEEMDETMIKNWNSRVRPEDTVYVVGDLFFRCEPERVEEILLQLQGRKHLVKGNHDESWMSKVDLDAYFESVEFMTEVNDNDRICVLCHYPLLSWRREGKSYMIYGHIHDNTNMDFWPLIAKRELMLNAGVEVNQYMPVTLDELIANNAVFREEHEQADEEKGGQTG